MSEYAVFTREKPLRQACWPALLASVLAVVVTYVTAPTAYAQQSSRSPSVFELQGKEASMEMPSGAMPGASQRAFGSKNMLGKNVPERPGYSALEKPVSGPTIKFSTQVETKVENKTTNHVSGGGGQGGPGGEPAPPPPPAGEAQASASQDFEIVVEIFNGKSVPKFGDALLANAEQFRSNEPVGIPAGYIIAVGDEIIVRAWGEIDIDHTSPVDRSGNIFLPRIGVIQVAGVPYAKLNDVLRKAIESSYQHFQLTASLSSTKSVLVHAVGLAKRPGTHQISAYSHFIDAVFAVGGPGARANYRRVVLKRDGFEVAQLDLYAYLSTGSQTGIVPIKAGDVLVFETMQAQAAVLGQVISPAIFQTKANSTLGELLALAGGMNVGADPTRILVDRIDDNQQRSSQWISDAKQFAAFQVKHGDIFMVFPAPKKVPQTVSLQGQVSMPLRQPWSEGLRLTDLIPSADFLVNPQTWQRHASSTTHDKLSTRTGKANTSTSGPNIHWEYASIERVNSATQSTRIIAVNLRKAIIDRDPEHNVLLSPGDIVTIYSKDDVRVASHQRNRHVRIEGEVGSAGVYPVQDGETLQDLIRRAGGLSKDAYLYGADFTRESVRQSQHERMTEALDRLEQDLHRAFANRVRNVLSSDEANASQYEAESLKSMVNKMRAIKPTGRIVLGMSPDASKLEHAPTLGLEDKDEIYIPRRPATVTVVGSVVREGSFLYSADKPMEDYIELAGGVSRHGDRANAYVIRPDGTILSAGQSLIPFLNISVRTHNPVLFPGDTVVIPDNLESTTLVKKLRDWTQVLYQFGLGAAGLKILRGN
jgi:polysaccharide biosynthesis/export protein